MGFANGFNSGVGMVRSYQDSERQKVKDGRDEQLWQQQLEDRARAVQQRGDEDAAFNTYDATRRGIYDGQNVNFNTVDAPAGPMPRDAYVPPTDMGTGLTPKRRDASRLEINDAQFGVAKAQRNVSAMSALDDKRNVLTEDDLISKAQIKPEDIQALNKNHKSITVAPMLDAKGKPTGYQTMRVTDAGDAIAGTMSMAESKKLAGALAIMEVNPTRAISMISEIDKGLADQLAREAGLIDKAVTSGNTARHNANADANDTARTGIAGAGLGLQRERINMEKMGSAKYFEDDKGNTFAAIPTMGKNGLTFQNVQINTDGQKGLKAIGPKGSAGALEKVPTDGTSVKDGKGNVFTYVEGEPIMKGGVSSSGRNKAIQSMGLPPQAESMLNWMPGGRYVQIGDDSSTVYDINTDKAAIKQALDRVVQSDAAAREMRARGGFTPRYSGGYPTAGGQGVNPNATDDPYSAGMQRPALMYPKP